MDQNILNTLAAKRLIDLSKDEKQQVNSWANTDVNASFLSDLHFIEDNSKEFLGYQSFNQEDIFLPNKRHSYKTLFTSIGIFLFAVLAIFAWKSDVFSSMDSDDIQYQIAFLPDQSEVKLFGSSTINYGSDYNQENRVVHLEGSAFFDVQHNPKKPFIIEHENLKVEVLGTSFLISENDGVAGVNVRDGKVKLTSSDGKVILLTEGQSITLTKSQFSEISNSASFDYLFSGHFEHVAARAIMMDIAEKNNMDLMFENEYILSKCFFNGSFENASIIEVLEEFKLLFGLEFQIGRKSLQLKDSDCI